jgi:tripeptide aminopeptidase
MPTDERLDRLMARDDVARARRWIEDHDAPTLALQKTIATIPAPTFAEAQRARFVAERLRAAGVPDVRADAAGNVHGRLGDGRGAGIVIAAHLDTVFAADTDLTPKGTGTRVTLPGIGDNARGLAAMLTMAEAFVRCDVALGAPITFVATVAEEGHGDLRGARALFDDPAFRPLAFIALDGPGLARVVHRALGTRRVRATFKGPGGHSWAAFGTANPAHAVGIAAAAVQALELPAEPRAAASVVRLGGGTGLNSIPTEAWLELDMRAEDETVLADVHERMTAAFARAVHDVNRRRTSGTAPLEVEVTLLGSRPSGTTDEHHPLVRAALAATRAVGGHPHLAAASTDANVAISRGVPGIALGAGGAGGDAHKVTEWYENDGGPAGIVRCLLVALAAG